uniref:Gem (Nuclear organelle) associated protein 5 n=1 Tax=Nothobranchius pienaari TaxID=704102 RepID=A0A1A8M009_9TELE
MNERSLPASPNWYCSRCSDVNSNGLLGFGANTVIYLVDVSASSCKITGELVGHRDLVSGFSFCQHPEQSHICVSTSTNGTVHFWDSSNKTLMREQAAHQNPVSAVHWSPADKNLVVSGDEKGVVVCHWFHTGDTASFFPEPRAIFCLSCSPHSWKSVAVGYKDGMIVLIDVSKKGEVMQRLRGHDNEIHSVAWCPVTGEDAFSSRAEDGDGADGVPTEGETGCFLASGSKDQTVRIWSTAKGKGAGFDFSGSREAIALVLARLPADEVVLKNLYTSWAAVLERDGHLSAAAKCYLAAGCGFDAAKVVSRKNDVPSLRTAASLARISGEEALAQSLALRCARDLAAAHDWVGAQDVLGSQPGLLVHRIHLCVAELLAALLEISEVFPLAPSASSHPWASPAQRSTLFLDRVADVWEEEFGVGADRADVLLQDLRRVESPTPSTSIPLRQVLLYCSVHLTRALLSWLVDDGQQLLEELWRAASWLRDDGHFCVSAEFCRLLFPDGDIRVFSRRHSKTLHPTTEASSAAASSLQAMVSYHRLYRFWWRDSAGRQDVQNGLPSDQPEDQLENPGSEELDFDVSVLLSEPHAISQAAHRSVKEIQDQLAAMVLQHNRVLGSPLDSGIQQDQSPLSDGPSGADAEQRSENQETFLSLSTKMSKYQKELSDLPESIKMFPRPDVVECCLVLLHLGRSSSSVSDVLQEAAKEMLRKHGSSRSIPKAIRRLCS